MAIASNQTLITFDDLLPQSNDGLIPNGYANLEWISFGVLDPQDYPGDSVGYLNGVVSQKHVAFNAYANSDGTTTGSFRAPGYEFQWGQVTTFGSAARKGVFQQGARLGFARFGERIPDGSSKI